MGRRVGLVILLALVAGACTSPAIRVVKGRSEPSPQALAPSSNPPSLGPLAAALPDIHSRDAPGTRVTKIAGYIQARWPRILLARANADGPGTVVDYQILAQYDGSIRDPDAYEQHVIALSGNLHQASVELLKLSVQYLPALRYASVWEDSFLRPFWSRQQIQQMRSAASYRAFDAYERLVVGAAVSPFTRAGSSGQQGSRSEPSPSPASG